MRILMAGLSDEAQDEARRLLRDLVGDPQFLMVESPADLACRLREAGKNLVLAGRDRGWDIGSTLRAAAAIKPNTPVLCLLGQGEEGAARALAEAGAEDAFTADQLWRLLPAVRRFLERNDLANMAGKVQGMESLLEAVTQLSLARRLEDVVEVVRHAARRISRADGATFVLREGDLCHYLDEDAIGPLWKGLRFPMSRCISGWAMLNRRTAVVPDIEVDPRIPIDAYRPTFVRSLVMVPIRADDPIGAIGTYWAERRMVPDEEVAMLQALADSTALALESVHSHADLERRVRERTASLEGFNKELETFSYSVSHDLRSPLSVILGYADLLSDPSRGHLTEDDRGMIRDMRKAAARMVDLIEDLLRLSRVAQREVEVHPVDLGIMAREILAGLAAADPGRRVKTVVADGLMADGDPGLLRIAMENLLANAWKYSSTRPVAVIEVGRAESAAGNETSQSVHSYFVRDNGVGFDMDQSHRLFEPFQRLQHTREFPGTGIGLATVRRVLQKHGGKVWAESEKEKGATFYFTLPSAKQV